MCLLLRDDSRLVHLRSVICESGLDYGELLKAYGISVEAMVATVRRVLKRKRR